MRPFRLWRETVSALLVVRAKRRVAGLPADPKSLTQRAEAWVLLALVGGDELLSLFGDVGCFPGHHTANRTDAALSREIRRRSVQPASFRYEACQGCLRSACQACPRSDCQACRRSDCQACPRHKLTIASAPTVGTARHVSGLKRQDCPRYEGVSVSGMSSVRVPGMSSVRTRESVRHVSGLFCQACVRSGPSSAFA